MKRTLHFDADRVAPGSPYVDVFVETDDGSASHSATFPWHSVDEFGNQRGPMDAEFYGLTQFCARHGIDCDREAIVARVFDRLVPMMERDRLRPGSLRADSLYGAALRRREEAA
jgi:hypothetical protein